MTKSKSTSKSRKTTTTKTATTPAPQLSDAAKLAAKLNREFGPCTVVRAVAQKFPKLRRRDVMSIATKLGINKYTASRQFQEVRSGEIEVVF